MTITVDTSRLDDTPFIVPDTTKATSTLCLKQEVKQDEIKALYRHLNVTGNVGLAKLDKFIIKENPKIGKTDLLFFDHNKHWQHFTNKLNDGFLVAKTLIARFSGLNTTEG